MNNILDLEKLYRVAKEHKDTHRGCGGEPYLDYKKLYSLVAKKSPQNILELGMGIGFTSLVMHLANSKAEIDTIETHGEHLKIAKEWFNEIKMSLKKSQGETLRNINIIQADVHNILPFLETKKYDFIFFDVYGPKEKFLVDFERILKPGGILYSVNSHLKSAEENYFKYLDNSDKWEKIDEFGDTKIYKMIY